MNSITPFATIKDFFNYLEDIVGHPHQKEHVIEMFREFKMDTNSFENFYSKFICLTSDLEYTSEILIRELQHKLTPRLQDQLNSRVKFLISILAFAKRCLSSYKQMQATDRIRDRIKLLRLTSTLAPTYSNTKTHQIFVTNSRANTLFLHLSSSIEGTFTPTSQHSAKKRVS